MSRPHIDPVIRSDPLKAAAGIGSSGDSDTVIFDPIEATSAALRSGNAIFEFAKAIILWLARGFIAPCEVILRRKFGERYFNGSVGFACLASLFMLRLADIFPEQLVVGIFAVFAVGSGINSLVCFIRDRQGKYWHSYSEGESWFRLPSIDRFLARWFFTFDFSKLVVEPLVLIGWAGLTMQYGGTTTRVFRVFGRYHEIAWNPVWVYLAASGVVLFCYQVYCWNVRRHRLLDALDHSVMSEIRAGVPDLSSGAAVQTHRGVSFLPRTAAQAWRS